MDPSALLADLLARGLTVRLDGETLRVGPADRVTAEVAALVRANKAVLVEALRAPACPYCRKPVDGKGRCWGKKCSYRRCSRCGRDTGSPLIELCVRCGFRDTEEGGG